MAIHAKRLRATPLARIGISHIFHRSGHKQSNMANVVLFFLLYDALSYLLGVPVRALSFLTPHPSFIQFGAHPAACS